MVTRVIGIGGNANILYPNGYNCKRGEYYGLSTDTKPTKGLHNGDIFYEMDKTENDNGDLVNKVYMFDEENGIWREQ